MRSNCPALIIDCGAIHDPPHASTLSYARYSARLLAVIPPDGRNSTLPNGPAIAFRYFTPPSASLGKTLRTDKPSLSAASISVGVATPGKTGIPFSLQY